MRNVVEIVKKMLEHIPAEEEIGIRELNKVIESAPYTAPECVMQLWVMLAEKINFVISQPPVCKDWEIKVLALFLDKTEEETRTLYGPKTQDELKNNTGVRA